MENEQSVPDVYSQSVLDIYNKYENEALTLRNDAAMDLLMGLAKSLDGKIRLVYLDCEKREDGSYMLARETQPLFRAGFVVRSGDSLTLTQAGRDFLSVLGIKSTSAAMPASDEDY